MKKILAVFLAAQMTLPFCAVAQQQPPLNTPPQTDAQPAAGGQKPAAAGQPVAPPVPMMTGRLRILVLEGSGAINNTENHRGTAPVVEIRDEDDRPVEGATVVFRLPPSGPGAVFPGQALSRTLKSNSQGQVMATGFIPNDQAGPFQIHVTATSGSKIGELDINQTNSANGFAPRSKPARVISRKWKLVAVGVAAAAVVAIVLVTTRGSAKPAPPAPNPTITITPGTVTIGGR